MLTDVELAEKASYVRERRRVRQERIDTLQRVFRSPSAKLGGVIFGCIALLILLAPLVAPYEPLAMDYSNMYAKPSAAHWFGTDSLGRDILSRLLYGGRYSLALGLISCLVGYVGGVVLGSVAGYFGGLVETLIMRFCDIWQSLPAMLLAILIAAVLGPSFGNTIVALAIGTMPRAARIIRGQILAERSKEYLEAAESINCSRFTIMFSHLLPNVVSPILVSATMGVGVLIIQAAGLSFLGLGIQPPTPEWGAMLSEGTAVLRSFPHIILFPGLAIGVCVLAINLMGDGVRDALDPKLRK